MASSLSTPPSTYTFRQAHDEVSAHSAGGAPFLIAYGATFFLSGLLAFFLPRPTVALIAMFQGAAALPVAFWLERRLGWGRLSPANPLNALSGLLAASQGLALPALIMAYSLNPGAVPVVLAAIGGVHFLPYVWLHRTPLYGGLGGALSLGAFALQVALQGAAFPYVLLFIALAYLVAAPLVYRQAARLTGGR